MTRLQWFTIPARAIGGNVWHASASTTLRLLIGWSPSRFDHVLVVKWWAASIFKSRHTRPHIHIGPLRPDAKGHTFILVIIEAFSRWVELYPTTTTTAVETASCIFHGSWNSFPQRDYRGAPADDRSRAVVDHGLLQWGERHRGEG